MSENNEAKLEKQTAPCSIFEMFLSVPNISKFKKKKKKPRVAVFSSSRGVGQLQVGHLRQLHLQGAVRAEQEQQRSAVLHLLGHDAERRERLPELQDQPESGRAVLRQLVLQRAPGPAHQQARWAGFYFEGACLFS